MIDVVIDYQPIELFKIIKLADLAHSGGQAKQLISEGMVQVNGETELRKRKKIVAGDCIELGEHSIRVSLLTDNPPATEDSSSPIEKNSASPAPVDHKTPAIAKANTSSNKAKRPKLKGW